MSDLIKSLWQLVESINAGHYAVDHADANTVGDAIDEIESLRQQLAECQKERDELKQNIKDMNAYMHKRIEEELRGQVK